MKSKMVKDFLRSLSHRLYSADAGYALALARLYANVAWNNPVGIYRADEIEDVVYGKISYIRDSVLENAKVVKNGKLLHVLTEGYTSGGHTRVLERLISIHACDMPIQDVVVVEICPAEVLEKMTALGASVRQISETGLRAIPILAAMMVEYSYVVLHIHPDDIVSSLCARIARGSGTKVALYNHADHCFTYGIRSVDLLCEISIYGQKISSQYRLGTPSSFAGIPLNIDAPVERLGCGNNTVLSSGPAYKFDLRDGGVFSSIVERVISDLGMRMMLIGPEKLPDNASAKLLHFIKSGKLIITPPVEYAVYIEHVRQCVCYIDSAPITGGSALPEAALAGVPCAGMTNAIMGYSLIDVVRSNSVDALIKRIKGFLDGTVSSSAPSRDELIEVHAPENVLRRIVTSLRGEATFSLPYQIDEAALDILYPQAQWSTHSSVIIHTRAFDFIRVSKRLSIFLLMYKLGIIAKLNGIAGMKFFFSSMAIRRTRNQ